MKLQNSSVSAHISRLAKLKWRGLKSAPPPPPHEDLVDEHPMGHLVEWYERLRRRATPTMVGHVPVTFSEMLAFRDLYGHELDAIDIDTLEKLDTVWLNSLPKRSQS
jgi:hypothetical protein